jgi:hypoxanthine-DNA glycosylase
MELERNKNAQCGSRLATLREALSQTIRGINPESVLAYLTGSTSNTSMKGLQTMIETHAFGNFVPLNAKYLILGSFTGRQAVKGNPAYDDSYDWFYGTKRNQFWPILEEVYGIELRDKLSKQELLTKLGIAMADIIYQCERKEGNNSDVNLVNKVYNKKAIAEILDNNQIDKIFFTSRDVEKSFKKFFKYIIDRHAAIELITLPSPSPRYVLIKKEQKISRYKVLFPKVYNLRSYTHGGQHKKKQFKWHLDPGHMQLIIVNENDRTLTYPLEDIKEILETLSIKFSTRYFPLANNVAFLGKGTERDGLGKIILDTFPGDITRAQGASYLGVVLEEWKYLDWNGQQRGIEWRFIDNDFTVQTLRSRLSKK